MATEPTTPPIAACGCTLSNLLKRSIALIDPPRYSGGSDNAAAAAAATQPADQAAVQSKGTAADADETTGADESNPDPLTVTSPTASKEAKKKVRFSESCLQPRKLISASDAIQAYDLLIHAASIADAGGIINDFDTSISWQMLNHVVDIYRALIVTCCLLMELLPPDLSTDGDDTSSITQHSIQISTNTQQKCPLGSINDPPCIPSLSPTIEKDMLSTSRRCILLLQALERICAAKMIALRHSSHNMKSNSSDNAIETFPMSSFYERGDDIHDYERSISDLYSNYDWHDDGFLPLPFFPTDDENGNKNENVSDDHAINSENQPSKPTNILQECCYLPQQSDPPSSKFEMSAWTRDWIRGERVVSLCLEDYQYLEEDDTDYQHDCNGDAEQQLAAAEEDYAIAFYTAGEGMLDITSESNDLATAEGIDSSEICHEASQDDLGEEDGTAMLDISPAALAEEEENLMEIMLSGEGSLPINSQSNSSTPTNATRLGNDKGRKKKKRKKKKHPKQSEEQDATNGISIHTTCNMKQIVHAKEGFLLLVFEDTPSNIFSHLSIHDQVQTNPKNNKTKSIRVFARLHPSGWLSIEDRSITLSRSEANEELTQQQPIPPRIRYLDLFIGPGTKCEPCLSAGVASSFHFRLDFIRLLGASSLRGPRCEDNNITSQTSGNSCTASTGKRVDLLFSVDEETGGEFVDGFDWVNALSGAASIANSLQESIQSEFE